MIITRKIQISINCQDKEEKKNYLNTLFAWQRISYQSANQVASHQFVSDNIKDMEYYESGIKRKLADIKKDEFGMLETSIMNTTYQVLSKKYKGELPMAIATGVNSQVVGVYNKERVDVFNGKKSLRSYRNTMPMPVLSRSLIKWEQKDKEYIFELHHIPFVTYFGRDRSGNKLIVDRCLNGEYKMCDSSIQVTDKKTFLLLCVDIPVKDVILLDRTAIARLDIETPIVVEYEKCKKEIGGKEEFLYRRLQIQESLRRLQIANKWNEGGKGRKHKLQSIERYHLKEKNYIITKLHKYSYELIKFCLENKCKILDLVDVKNMIEEGKKNEFILRNWSYYGLLTLIKYKAKKFGIQVNVI